MGMKKAYHTYLFYYVQVKRDWEHRRKNFLIKIPNPISSLTFRNLHTSFLILYMQMYIPIFIPIPIHNHSFLLLEVRKFNRSNDIETSMKLTCRDFRFINSP